MLIQGWKNIVVISKDCFISNNVNILGWNEKNQIFFYVSLNFSWYLLYVYILKNKIYYI